MLDHYLALDFEGRMRFMTTDWKPMDSAPKNRQSIYGCYEFLDKDYCDEWVCGIMYWSTLLLKWVTSHDQYGQEIIPLCWTDLPLPPTQEVLRTLENSEIKSNST